MTIHETVEAIEAKGRADIAHEMAEAAVYLARMGIRARALGITPEEIARWADCLDELVTQEEFDAVTRIVSEAI
jgi:replicative superfamily II helicase